jgi:hypothetical protein
MCWNECGDEWDMVVFDGKSESGDDDYDGWEDDEWLEWEKWGTNTE